MATTIVQHDVEQRLARIEVQLRPFVDRLEAQIAQLQRLTGDELSDGELEYCHKVARGESIGFDDVPASLLPDC